MDKMERNIEVNSIRDRLASILRGTVSESYSENDISDLIAILKFLIEKNTDTSTPEVYALISEFRASGYPNRVVQILCDEIELRSLRKVLLRPDGVPYSGDTPTKKYKEDLDNEKYDAAKTAPTKDRRRFLPTNGEFRLPDEGRTNVLYNKNISPDTGEVLVEKLLIDHDGYVVDVLDTYTEEVDNTEDPGLAYTDILSNILNYGDDEEDISSDMYVPGDDYESAVDNCDGDCDGCCEDD